MLYFLNMAAKETTFNELGEMLAHVVQHMVTKYEVRDIVKAEVSSAVKDEIAAAKLATKADLLVLSEQVTSIERDLKQIKRDLSDLTDKVENIAGYRKEIDHALERIAAIENHLGLKPKFAA
jgi:predicted phage-related endonuclease